MSTTVTFDISANGDDGYVEGHGGAYPPTTGSSYDSSGTILYAAKQSGGFYVMVGLLRFDTATIPDDATILSAKLKLTANQIINEDNRSLTAEYYTFTTMSNADYSYVVGTNAIAGEPLSNFVANTQRSISLSNLENINKTGYTGFRLHISGGQPIGENKLYICAKENGSKSAQLEVTYSTGWPGKIFGVQPSKIFGVTPAKVNGI